MGRQRHVGAEMRKLRIPPAIGDLQEGDRVLDDAVDIASIVARWTRWDAETVAVHIMRLVGHMCAERPIDE